MAIGWAFIGTGRYPDRVGAPGMALAGDTELIATYSRDRGRAQAFAEKHGAASAYDSLDDLLKDSKVDAVFIASPNSLHSQHALQAARAGKHVLSEKPMTTTLEDAVAMVRGCRDNGVKLGAGYHLRTHPGHIMAQRLIAEGALGHIAMAQAQWGFGVRGSGGPPPRTGLRLWWDDPELIGGASTMMGTGVHAVDLLTGELRWTTTIEDHPASRITGAPALHDGRLYVPVASLEELSAADPRYECCTFRGSVVALDAATGERIWKTYVIRESPQPTRTNSAGTQNHGPSGAGVWSAPTLDPARNLLYVATGDAYSDPAAVESDAIVALTMDTGEIQWVRQTTPGDAFTIACVGAGLFGLPGSDNPIMRANCPESEGPDFDYGSSPILITRNGDDLLLSGQKSGVMYGIRPEDGEIVWETRVSDGGLIGGIEWGFATDGNDVFVSISDTIEKPPGEAGGVTALRVDDGEVVWHAPPVQDTCGGREGCHTGQPAAMTLIPGVAFAGSLDGHLRAHATDTGQMIWDFDTAAQFRTVNGVEGRGGSINGPGPTVVDGMVYVVSGYGSFGFMPGNVLLAFGVED